MSTGTYLEKFLEFESHIYGTVQQVLNNDTNIYIVNEKKQLFGFGGNRYHQLQLPVDDKKFHDVRKNGYICGNVKKVQVDILCAGILTLDKKLYRIGYIDKSLVGMKRRRIFNNVEDFSIRGNKLAVIPTTNKYKPFLFF